MSAGYEFDDRAYVHFGDGPLAHSDDGEAWEEAAAPNLAAKAYFGRCVTKIGRRLGRPVLGHMGVLWQVRGKTCIQQTSEL
ncbi:hypothetical protein [Mesorhizobium sp. CAU 1741]|uniref:hypothetical protein n=1 Tax=Mesorhizobium sp. CAU 1741 TaxID=3140366 RepID=UPI00325B7531